MNISEVKNLVVGASYEGKIEVLEELAEKVGDCSEIGFLGSSVSNISYDEYGKVEFESEKYGQDIITKSTGAVLSDSIIIMQIQNGNDSRLMQLYSWKLDGSKYTYLTFDSELVLKKAYDGVKKTDKGFLAENLDNDLQELGISYRDIMDIKVAVNVDNHDDVQSEMINILNVETLQTSFIS